MPGGGEDSGGKKDPERAGFQRQSLVMEIHRNFRSVAAAENQPAKASGGGGLVGEGGEITPTLRRGPDFFAAGGGRGGRNRWSAEAGAVTEAGAGGRGCCLLLHEHNVTAVFRGAPSIP
jgi:hypothetical protein